MAAMNLECRQIEVIDIRVPLHGTELIIYSVDFRSIKWRFETVCVAAYTLNKEAADPLIRQYNIAKLAGYYNLVVYEYPIIEIVMGYLRGFVFEYENKEFTFTHWKWLGNEVEFLFERFPLLGQLRKWNTL